LAIKSISCLPSVKIVCVFRSPHFILVEFSIIKVLLSNNLSNKAGLKTVAVDCVSVTTIPA